MNITPIQFGDRYATQITLTWISKPFFSEQMCLRVEYASAEKDFLWLKDIEITSEEYAVYVTAHIDKAERAIAILTDRAICQLISE